MCLSHCSLGSVFRVKWAAVKPPVICAFWKAVSGSGALPRACALPLRHPASLRPMSKSQARNRKTALRFSSQCEWWEHTSTMAEEPQKECYLPPLAIIREAPRIPPSVPERPPEFHTQSQAVGNRGVLGKSFNHKISIPCIFSRFFTRARKMPPHICSLWMSQIRSQTKGYPRQDRMLKSQSRQLIFLFHFN